MHKTRRRALWIGLGLVVVCNVAFIEHTRSRRATHSNPPGVVTGRSEEALKLIETEFEKIDNRIQVIRNESFDELFGHLNDPYATRLTRVHSGATMTGVDDLAMTLANRRVLRLCEMLAKRPRERACSRLRKEFQSKLKAHTDAFEPWLTQYENHVTPLRTTETGLPRPAASRGALCGIVFLTAEFCGVSEVVDQLRQVRAAIEQLEARLTNDVFDKHHRNLAPRAFEPDVRFQLSVLARAVEFDEGFPEGRKDAFRAELNRLRPMGFAVFRRMPLVTWDERFAWFDRVNEWLDGQKTSRSRETRMYNACRHAFGTDSNRRAQRPGFDKVVSILMGKAPETER